MSKRLLIPITLFTLISLSVFAKNATPKDAELPPAMVETSTVHLTSQQVQIATTGNVIAIPGITIKPEASGRITKIFFKSGDQVTAGAPLIEINPDILKARLTQTIAEWKLAQLNYERSAKLYETHSISKADLDNSKAKLSSTKAEVDSAQASLNQTTVTAPFSGQLGLSAVNLGDFVNIGQNIVNLESLDPIFIDFTIPEVYLKEISKGQTILIRSDIYPKETFTGTVVATESRIDPTNRTLKLRAAVANKEGKLLPGTFVEVNLLTKKLADVISIPQTAVVYSSDGNYVFTVEKNKAVKVSVQLGDRTAENIVVTEGLKPGDVVITAGQQKVHPGGPVIIINDKNQTPNQQ